MMIALDLKMICKNNRRRDVGSVPINISLSPLLNPDLCNPDFRLNRTDWKVMIPSYTFYSYTHNPDFA